MSHVTAVTAEITDLASLTAAAVRLGGKLSQKQTFRNYQGHGRCEYAIQLPGCTYEVGVVRANNGPGYTLLFDSWNTGGLGQKIGAKAEKLVQAYGIERFKAAARRKGHAVVRERVLADGTVSVLIGA